MKSEPESFRVNNCLGLESWGLGVLGSEGPGVLDFFEGAEDVVADFGDGV